MQFQARVTKSKVISVTLSRQWPPALWIYYITTRFCLTSSSNSETTKWEMRIALHSLQCMFSVIHTLFVRKRSQSEHNKYTMECVLIHNSNIYLHNGCANMFISSRGSYVISCSEQKLSTFHTFPHWEPKNTKAAGCYWITSKYVKNDYTLTANLFDSRSYKLYFSQQNASTVWILQGKGPFPLTLQGWQF